MEFNEFIGNVVDSIPEYLLQYEIDNIHIDKVCKNNGIICTGMAICLKGEKITPNIYLEYYYKLYKSGQSFDDVLGLIRDDFNKARSKLKKDVYIEMSKENLEKCVFVQLVNFEKNSQILKECPFIPFMDLAITFRYLVKKDEEGIASALIRNRDMKEWGVTKEELYEMAKERNRQIFPPSIKSLNDVMKDIVEEFDVSEKFKLYVLSNSSGVNGAVSVIYEDIIREFANKINSDIFILPSSIHEVLLLPASDNMNKTELEEMVKEINEFVVDDMDFLSDNVYFYDRKQGRFSI